MELYTHDGRHSSELSGDRLDSEDRYKHGISNNNKTIRSESHLDEDISKVDWNLIDEKH